MSIIICQKAIPLKCQRCSHIWNYKGKNEYVATCPHCRTFVTIKKHSILLIDRVSQPKQPVERLADTSKDGPCTYG